MDGDGFNRRGNHGIQGAGYGFAGNVGNFGEGSSDSNTSMGVGKMQGNIRLGRDEVEVNSKAAAWSPQNFANATSSRSGSVNLRNPGFYIERASDLLIIVSLNAEPTRSKICQMANSAMDELWRVAVAGKPLWQFQDGHKFDIMDNIEYLQKYCQQEEMLKEILKMAKVGEYQELPSYESLRVGYAPKPKPIPKEDVKTEASRDIKYVKMSPLDIVKLLMDTTEWSRAFYNIVASSTFLGVLSNGEQGSYDGKLQVMSAEFQLPTPFATTWDSYFARYCKKLTHNMWGVVDFLLEKHIKVPINQFRRRPSGCLIKEMPDGYSKVVWVEHLVAESCKYNTQFQPLVSSGLAFGAARWLASLVRTIECAETLKASPAPTHYGISMPKMARTGLLNLAERMMRIFCADISASSSNRWTQVASLISFQDLKIKVKNVIESFGRPRGTAVIFSASICLPTPPRILSDFLRDANYRMKWDMLSRQFPVRELVYAIRGNDPRNRVSIIEANTGLSNLVMYYVQESYTDTSGISYVVYSPVDKLALKNVSSGGNPNLVNIMPSGFVIFPDGMSPNAQNDGGGGSILTMAYYVIVGITGNPLIIPHETIALFNKVIASTIAGIQGATLHNNA